MHRRGPQPIDACATFRTRAEERLVVVLGGLLPLLLVAAVSAAVALPRHGAGFPAEVPAIAQRVAPTETVVPKPPSTRAPRPLRPVPTVVAPPEGDQAAGTGPEAVPDPDHAPPTEAGGAPAVESDRDEGPESPPAEAVPEPAEQEEAAAPPPTIDATPAPAPPPAPAPAPAPAPSPEPQEQGQAQAAAGEDERSESERIFAREFPTHAAARQTEDPASRSWAVLVGVNRYAGRTSDTLGSVADVLVLREVLLRKGWQNDHILVLTDEAATHDRIVRGLEWLHRSTDEDSTVVFSFSGHIRHDRSTGVSALWPTDNRFLWAEDFGRLMAGIPAGRLWASLQGCHAEGMRAAGLEGPNRVVTYSSRVVEKSYEDPEVGHSVQGYYLFAEGLRDRWGDADDDGRVSVQEAWRWASPRTNRRTSMLQTPVIADGTDGSFHLGIDRGP